MGHTHFGRSLLPALGDPDALHRTFACAEGGFRISDVALFEAAGWIYQPKADLQRSRPELVGTAMVLRTETHTYVHRRYEGDELYDRIADSRGDREPDQPARAGGDRRRAARPPPRLVGRQLRRHPVAARSALPRGSAGVAIALYPRPVSSDAERGGFPPEFFARLDEADDAQFYAFPAPRHPHRRRRHRRGRRALRGAGASEATSSTS